MIIDNDSTEIKFMKNIIFLLHSHSTQASSGRKKCDLFISTIHSKLCVTNTSRDKIRQIDARMHTQTIHCRFHITKTFQFNSISDSDISIKWNRSKQKITWHKARAHAHSSFAKFICSRIRFNWEKPTSAPHNLTYFEHFHHFQFVYYVFMKLRINVLYIY